MQIKTVHGGWCLSADTVAYGLVVKSCLQSPDSGKWRISGPPDSLTIKTLGGKCLTSGSVDREKGGALSVADCAEAGSADQLWKYRTARGAAKDSKVHTFESLGAKNKCITNYTTRSYTSVQIMHDCDNYRDHSWKNFKLSRFDFAIVDVQP